MRRLAYFAFIFLLALSGCATSKFTQTGQTYPVYTGPVKVLSERPPEGTYDEIGLISSSGGQIHEWTHLISALQKKAAKHGANAIVAGTPETNRVSSVTYNQSTGLWASSGTTKSMTAVAIRLRAGVEGLNAHEIQ